MYFVFVELKILCKKLFNRSNKNFTEIAVQEDYVFPIA